MDFDRWSYEVMQMVKTQGRTMEESAKRAYDKGEIDKRHYMTYVQSSKYQQAEDQDG